MKRAWKGEKGRDEGLEEGEEKVEKVMLLQT